MLHEVAGVWAGSILTFLAAAATIILGLFVLRLAPGEAPNRAFAAVAGAVGVGRLTAAFVPPGGSAPLSLVVIAAAATGLYSGAAVWLASVFPRRRALALRPWGFRVVLLAAYGLALILVGVTTFTATVTPFISVSAFVGGALALAYALDARRIGARSYPLLVIGFSAYTCVVATSAILRAALTGVGEPWQWIPLALFAGGLACALAAAATARSRLAALGVLAFVLAGIAHERISPTVSGGPLVGIARLALPALVAVALVRHQLFDFDRRLKWGIRRGTLAGVFVAVFFVVGTIASEALVGSYGYMLGGVAAGLLLFAIRPLERVAERVADVALPEVREAPPVATASADERRAAYRDAVRMALADGIVTRPEERALASLAHALALNAPEALALREDVERELNLAAA